MAQTTPTIEQLKAQIQQIQTQFENQAVDPNQAMNLIQQMKQIFVQLVAIENNQDAEISNLKNSLQILESFVGFTNKNPN